MGGKKKDGSLKRAISIFKEGMQKDKIPLTLVAINLATELPVASLKWLISSQFNSSLIIVILLKI